MGFSSGVGWEFFRAEYVAAMAPWEKNGKEIRARITMTWAKYYKCSQMMLTLIHFILYFPSLTLAQGPNMAREF